MSFDWLPSWHRYEDAEDSNLEPRDVQPKQVKSISLPLEIMLTGYQDHEVHSTLSVRRGLARIRYTNPLSPAWRSSAEWHLAHTLELLRRPNMSRVVPPRMF